MILSSKVFGISLEAVIIILLLLIVILGIVLVLVVKNLNYINRKYYTIMSGKKGKDLEKVIFTRFKEMDNVKANSKRITKEHKEIQNYLSLCYCKIGLVKYDAFNDLTGELSFSLALLNKENSGVVINAMHSKQGCFTYAKEIIKGESYIVLSEEEKQAIKKAMTIDEEIKKLTNIEEEELPDVTE